MLNVQVNRKPFGKSIDTLFDGLWAEFPSVFKHDFNEFQAKGTVPVNVKESEAGYELEVVAPGFEKADFSINLDQNLLTVSAEKKTEVKEENQTDPNAVNGAKDSKIIRKEYSYRSFKRTFTLDEKIDATRIEASYINGVLLLSIPKKEVVKQAAKTIEIK